MFIQRFLAASLVARLASLVAAVPPQHHLPRADICTATITVTSVVNGGSSSPSSNSNNDPVTVTIVNTITVTNTAYASPATARLLTAAISSLGGSSSNTNPSDPQDPVKTVTLVNTVTVTQTAYASLALTQQAQQFAKVTVTSLIVSTATVTSTVTQPTTITQTQTLVQTVTQSAVVEDPAAGGSNGQSNGQRLGTLTENLLTTVTTLEILSRPAANPTPKADPPLILPSSVRPPYTNGTRQSLFNSTSNSSSPRPLAGSSVLRPAQPSPVASRPAVIPSFSAISPSTNGSGTGTGSSSNPIINSSSSGGYESSLYFANWAIYGANFQPQSLPVNQVTRINYAFADIDTSTGEVISSDTYADLEKHYSTDSWNDNGTNAYGCIKQLYLLKKANRNLKVLLAIGGWTYSSKFSPVAATAQLRAAFAASAVKLVTDWGFDGVDIDWEFNAYTPAAGDAQNIILLLQEVRNAFDAWAKTNANGYHFIISVASPAGPATYDLWDMAAMDPYVDTWNLMAYDYAGTWSNASGHQANLYFNSKNPDSTPYSTDQAVSAYVANGISPNKILLGLPLYGRSFEDTAGLGLPFSGVGVGDDLGDGQWRLKDLPRTGAQEIFDSVAGASYSYDAGTQELISYDNAQSAQAKSVYLKQKSLGGAMFWEASDDRNGTESLVGIMSGLLGGLKSSQNLLSYPTSQYNNIRDMMAES